MLMSASTSDLLAIDERLFDNSHVTPAVRANDTSDIFVGAAAVTSRSRAPFRTASLDHIQCGHVDCEPRRAGPRRQPGSLQRHVQQLARTTISPLEEYKEFREEAERKGFRHFLEVFDPNAPQALRPSKWPASSTTSSPARWPAWPGRAGRCF